MRSPAEFRDWIKTLLTRSDMLVDATARRDTTRYILANSQVGLLPNHAVIVDLAADPYNTDTEPIQVKG